MPNWSEIEAVVFDVDGTLYSQKTLRLLMLKELSLFYIQHPQRIKELLILSEFRKNRERLSLQECNDIITLQYQNVANKFDSTEDQVKEIIDEWIHQRPLKFLNRCKFSECNLFIETLKNRDVAIGVLSDYDAANKLESLEIKADAIVSAEEKDVNVLKPQTKGMEKIISLLGSSIHRTLYIGNRVEMDGECAKRIGMQYLNKSNSDSKNSFSCYSKLIQSIEKNGN